MLHALDTRIVTRTFLFVVILDMYLLLGTPDCMIVGSFCFMHYILFGTTVYFCSLCTETDGLEF